jgi:uncharacterized protein YwgA
MLRRQRITLNLIANAGSISATQLQKYLFLMKEETFLRDDSAFYEFLPYKCGPYSFAATRETESLTSYGYVSDDSSTSATTLTISALGREAARQVDGDTSRAVLAIVLKYGKVPLQTLLKDVYGRYPWYATNTELNDIKPAVCSKPKAAPAAVYTMGYEDRSVDGFFNKLIRAGIHRVIDVRSNPVSRKYGFARSSLQAIALKLGMEYTHHPELGITSEKRKGVESSSELQELFSYYEQRILPTKTDEIDDVTKLLKAAPSVLVCMEKEAVDCHRSRLATRIAESTGLRVVHL